MAADELVRRERDDRLARRELAVRPVLLGVQMPPLEAEGTLVEAELGGNVPNVQRDESEPAQLATGVRWAAATARAGPQDAIGDISPSRPFSRRKPSACSACIILWICVVPS
jgi:hypothetical protein